MTPPCSPSTTNIYIRRPRIRRSSRETSIGPTRQQAFVASASERAPMNKSSILTCALAIGCLQACAGHSIDLDQGASPAPNGTDPVGVDVIQLPDSISYLG